MANEIQNQETLTPAQMIMQAVQGGADLEKMEKLLELHERWEASQAKKIYADSFSLAQTEIESVTKEKTNNQTHSKYATLEDIIESSKPVYTKHGFSVVFYEGETTKPDHVRICADVSHKAGHKETYYYDVPLDGKGIKGNANMTAIHAKASSTSYGRRYLMCMIWNIATDDDDGNKADTETIDEKQLHELVDMIITVSADEEKFCAYLGVEELKDLRKSDYQKALSALKAKQQKGK